MTTHVVEYKFDNNSQALTDPVSALHFGSGFENRGQEVTAGSPFRNVESKLDLEYLRYPGGTQTENYFDPGDPNNSNPVALFNNAGSTANFVPIKDFLSYAASDNIQPVIVIPTWRYFDKSSGSVKAEAEQEIKGFVRDILTGKHGNVNVEAFEIGNEWSNENFSWTPAQFAELQSKIAYWIDEVRSDLNLSYNPKILAQVSHTGMRDLDKNGQNDNAEILAAFNKAEMSAVDGVIDHFYQPTRADNVLDDYYFESKWVPQNRVEKLEEDGWKVKGEGAIDIFTTEWNVRDSHSEKDQVITGFENLPMFLRLFSDMQIAGVDGAMVFTTQALGSCCVTLSRLGEDTLTPTGHLFKMMKDALPGTRIMDPNKDGTLSRDEFVFKDTAGKEAGFTYTYSSKDKTVVYFSSAVKDNININADFSHLIDAGYSVKGIAARVDGGNALSSDANAVLKNLDYNDLDGDVANDGILDISLGSHELIQLEFVRKQGSSDSDNDSFVF